MFQVVRYILIISALFCAFINNAQELGFKIFGNEEGLIHKQIIKIKQDSLDYLWLASYTGCSRFDGKEFLNFTKQDGLSNSQVWDFSFINDTVFVLESGKIDIIINNKVFPYNLPEKLLIYGYDFLYVNEKLCISCIDTINNSYHVLDIKKKKKLHSFDYILSNSLERHLIHQMDGKLFLLSKPNNDVIFTEIGKNESNDYDTVSDNIYTYINTYFKRHFGNANILIKTSDKKYQKSKNKEFLFNHFPRYYQKVDSVSFVFYNYKSIALLRKDRIHKLNFDFNYIYYVIQAKDKSVWVATDIGLVKLFTSGIYNYPVRSGYTKNSWCIFPEETNKIWLGSMTKGLFCFENAELTKSITKFNNGNLSPYYGSSKGFKNDMVIPTGNKGLFVYDFDKQKGKLIKCHKKEDCLFVWKDTVDQRIITGMRSLYFLNSDYSLDLVCQIGQHIYQQKINAACRKDNYYYLSTGNDVLKFNILDSTQRWMGLKDIRFNSLHIDYKNNLWVASEQGIYLITKKDTLRWLEEFNFIALTIDNNQRLYSVCKNELYVLNLKEYYTNGKVVFHRFGEDEGFMGAGEQNAFYKDEDGLLWLPGAENNVLIYPNELNMQMTGVQAQITNAICITESLNTKISKSSENELSYHHKDFLFKFHAVCLKSPGKVMYQYRLKGYETEWSKPTRKRSVRYTNIQPGKYYFEVKSSLVNQFEKAKISGINFKINNPFWFKWWFILISAVFIAFILLIIIKWRIKVSNKKLLLNNKLQELEMETLHKQIEPHFIGNSLETIRNKINKGEYNEGVEAINAFGKVLRNTTQNIKRSFITLSEEIEITNDYLKFQKVYHNQIFNFSLPDIKKEMKEIEIPPLVLQAFVENSIIHGFRNIDYQGHISINFKNENNYAIISIKDNGMGGMKNNINNKNVNTHKSTGIQNSIERLRLLNPNIDSPIEIIDLDIGLLIKIKLKVYGSNNSRK